MGLEEITKALLVYGPLGLICAVLLIGYVQKDRQMSVMQKDFLDKQEALMKAHKIEMQSLEERYISKAESWMEKYRERAEAQNDVIKALDERMDGIVEHLALRRVDKG